MLHFFLTTSLALQIGGVSRRTALATTTLAAAPQWSPMRAHARDVGDDYTTTRGLEQQPVVPTMQKLPSGVRYVDIRVGTGASGAQLGSRVSLQWVLRRSNGYFVDSSIGALSSGPAGGTLSLGGEASQQFDPFIFTVGSGTAVAGVDEAVVGMRQGGVRRIVVPIGAGYTLPLDKSAGPLPSGFGPRRQIERELAKQDPYNYFFFEVEAVRVTSSS